MALWLVIHACLVPIDLDRHLFYQQMTHTGSQTPDELANVSRSSARGQLCGEYLPEARAEPSQLVITMTVEV